MRFIGCLLLCVAAFGQDREAALGKGLAAEVERELPVVENSRIQTQLDAMAARLRPGLPEVPFAYTIRLVAGDGGRRTHEPIGLPGGYLYVPTTLILAARNESELAGMLAHGMAHIAARHGMRHEGRGSTVPLIFLNGWQGYGSADLGTPLIPQGFIQTMRLQEYDADRLAVTAMAKAGYDPLALAAYLGRVQPESSLTAHSAMPPKAERIDSIEEAVRYIPQAHYAPAADLAELQREVNRLVIKPERKAPTLRRGVIPVAYGS